MERIPREMEVLEKKIEELTAEEANIPAEVEMMR